MRHTKTRTIIFHKPKPSHHKAHHGTSRSLVLLATNDVNCHGRALILHRLKQAEVSCTQPVVADKLTPFSREHPLVEHLGKPCLAPPVLTELQGLLPIRKMRSGISRRKVLYLLQKERGKWIIMSLVQKYHVKRKFKGYAWICDTWHFDSEYVTFQINHFQLM